MRFIIWRILLRNLVSTYNSGKIDVKYDALKHNTKQYNKT